MNFDYISFLFLSSIALLVSLHIAKSDDDLNLVIYANILSLIAILCYLLLDSPDVALTEASVGACANSVILFATITKIGEKNLRPKKSKSIILIFIILGFFLITMSALNDMPIFGQESNISNNHLANYYLKYSGKDIGIKSNISSILASYRGFDTLGEALVILIGAISVASILVKRNIK